MIDITNKKALEDAFAENFASPYYPVLANLYLQEGDLVRAKKVCEVGLEHDGNNIDGKFILAKIALAENKLTVAEKWLKLVVLENPAHFRALRLLVNIEFQLKRSHNTIRGYVLKLLQYLPDDAETLHWLSELGVDQEKSLEPATEDNSKNIKNSAEDSPSPAKPSSNPHNSDTYTLEPSMATFTMVQVLKSQKHFNQAILVLNMLESKGKDPEKIAALRSDIQSLLEQSRDNT
ncbi:MAG: hypothetical protein QGF36_00595 [Candidatus Marinimicrobia bacterium]|nr:hypothetical protein [Candidatus Neomarinimicrobiota bacterium]